MGVPLFSLKGWNNTAQGTALGGPNKTKSSPERAQQKKLGSCGVMPFQGEKNQPIPPFPGRCPGLSCLAPSGRQKVGSAHCRFRHHNSKSQRSLHPMKSLFNAILAGLASLAVTATVAAQVTSKMMIAP